MFSALPLCFILDADDFGVCWGSHDTGINHDVHV
jgi:hypothetical protein